MSRGNTRPQTPSQIQICRGKSNLSNPRAKNNPIQAIPPLTLQALHTLSLAPTALLNPSPKVVTYMTYIAVVYRLSAYIGPQAVRELIKDFNRTNPNRAGGNQKVVRKVPGIGPRVVRRGEGESGGPVRSRKSSLGKRDRERGIGPPPVAYRALAREGLTDPMSSAERLLNPKRSVEQLVNAHPATSPAPRPFAANDRARTPRHMRSRETIRNEPLVSLSPEPRLRHMTSRETLNHPPSRPMYNSTLMAHPPRRMRSQETFAPSSAPASPTSLFPPSRSQARPYPYPFHLPSPTTTDSGIQTPDLPSPKRRSRTLEYIRNKLGRISRIYSIA
ncbi:hypothetical protein FRC11_003450 [Ceratobasidium sp. 423]|nr:hypothetical protein FRC11_003450 [Ceratobasidium sp. 423]